MAPITNSQEDTVQETSNPSNSNNSKSIEFNSSNGSISDEGSLKNIQLKHEVDSNLDKTINNSIEKIPSLLKEENESKNKSSRLNAQSLCSEKSKNIILGEENVNDLESIVNSNETTITENSPCNESDKECSTLLYSQCCHSGKTNCDSKYSKKCSKAGKLDSNSDSTSHSNVKISTGQKDDIKLVDQSSNLKQNEAQRNKIVDEEEIKNKDKLLSFMNQLSLKTTPVELTNLTLVGLDLDSINYDFSPFVNVTCIDLSNNNLNALPQSLSSLKNCTRLIISKNKLTEIPSILYRGMYFIRDLDMSFNSFDDFNMAPLCLSYLVNLNLSHNNLSSPPLWLLQDVPSSLKYLDLSFNPCLKDKLQASFLNTSETNSISSRILNLNISNTGFVSKHIQFLKHFTCLKVLRMNSKQSKNSLDNYMEDLPTDLLNLMPLEELEAEDCSLSCLPNNIDKLSHLKVFRISNNDISWLPEGFVHLQCLSILVASKCHLVYLPREMELMTSLTELWLSYNDIPSLPDLRKCKNLKLLDLYSNGFTQLPDTLHDLKLEALDICGNYFSPSTYKQAADGATYDSLKINLRERLGKINNRTDFIKIDYYSKHSSSSGSSGSYSSSKSYGSYRSSRSKKSTPGSSYSRLSAGSSKQDECWDVDPDDAWDPNLYTDMRKYKSDESLSRVRYIASLTHRENYFCPFQEKSNFYQNVYVGYTGPDENGQFEDA